MGKPYSLDLRKRVVAAIEGGMSRNRAAKQFGVAISTAIGWMHGRRDRQYRAWPDGRSQAEGGLGRSRSLAVAADQGRRFHPTRSRCRACRTWPEGRLPLGVGVRACREAQLQKKAWRLANAIDPRSRGGEPSGQSIKVASKLSGWSSSMRPGPGPIWRPCGDGRRAGTDFMPRFPTAAGRP